MSKSDKFLRWAEVIATVVFAVAAAGVLYIYARANAAEPVVARATVPCYTNPGGAGQIVDSGCTFNVKTGGTLQVDSGATETHANTESHTGTETHSGAMTLSGGSALGGMLSMTAGVTQTVTNSTAFTPTATFQPISSAGSVTPTITAGVEGQLLILENVGSNTINLADSGTQNLTGAVALGQYDTITLIYDGTTWTEIAASNN